MGEQPRLINPFYVAGENDQHRPSPLLGSRWSTYEAVVGATDGLLGARSTGSSADGRDRVATEPEEAADIGKSDPEQSTEVVEGCGGRLQRGS